MENKIRISVADDHPVVIDGLEMMLQNRNDMEIAGRYLTGFDLMNGLKSMQPDLLILDIKLPDIPGDELITQVLEKYPNTKILVLSYLDNIYYVKTMIRQGALGYVLKTCSKEVLIEAIKAVAGGQQFIEQEVKETLVQHALVSRKESMATTILTKREKEILQLIASNLSSQQIADKLFLSLKTIEFHRSNLLLKLKAKNAASLVKKAMQMNLLE
jgi:DNA-binding NarL/FixJ family response regulator